METWERTYGGAGVDEGRATEQTADGGYVITGATASFGAGQSDVYLIRTDALGETLWTKTFGGAADDVGNSVQQTTDGGYIIAGSSISFGQGGSALYLIKTDSRGDTLWTRSYVGKLDAFGYSVRQAAGGGYVIAEITRASHMGYADVYVVKTDAHGDTLWTRTFGGDFHDQGSSVEVTDDGGYIITGYTNSYGAGSDDAYLIKTNASGDTLWTRTFGVETFDCGAEVQQTDDGGYIVVGTAYADSGNNLNVHLIRANAAGDTLWTRNFGGPGDDWGNSVRQTADGGFIVGGQTWVANDSWDVYLAKTSAHGDTLWTRTFGGPNPDLGYSVQPTTDGGYVIAGSTRSSGTGNSDVHVIKTDSLGKVGP
jgi:hypothetical protein